MTQQLKVYTKKRMFFIFNIIIPNEISENGLINKTINNIKENNYEFYLTSYYKNGKLNFILITLSNSYIADKNTDETTDIKMFIDFWRLETNNLINTLIKTKKRKFNWGKIDIKTDPRNPTVFAEFKSHN